MAELEVTAANSLINYSNALQYGVINPGKIFERYYMVTKLPDSAFMKKAFQIDRYAGLPGQLATQRYPVCCFAKKH